MIIANVHKAKTELSKLIAAVLSGEEVVIAKNNEPIVDLVKHKKTKKKGGYAILMGKINVPDNFDDEDTEINKLFYGE